MLAAVARDQRSSVRMARAPDPDDEARSPACLRGRRGTPRQVDQDAQRRTPSALALATEPLVNGPGLKRDREGLDVPARGRVGRGGQPLAQRIENR